MRLGGNLQLTELCSSSHRYCTGCELRCGKAELTRFWSRHGGNDLAKVWLILLRFEFGEFLLGTMNIRFSGAAQGEKFFLSM